MARLYHIRSNLPLADIEEHLSNFGEYDFLHILRKGGRPTLNNVAVLGEETFKALENSGYTARNETMTVSPFDIHPATEKSNTSSVLFVSVPTELKGDRIFVESALRGHLQRLQTWGIIPEACWRLQIMFASRETGEIGRGCKIIFNSDTSFETISAAMIALNGYKWEEETDWSDRPHYIKCTRFRTRRPREETEE